jgi:hypothetical protein
LLTLLTHPHATPLVSLSSLDAMRYNTTQNTGMISAMISFGRRFLCLKVWLLLVGCSGPEHFSWVSATTILQMDVGEEIVSDNKGGELASLPIITMSDTVFSYRQDMCDQYQQVRNGTLMLREALQGITLNVIIGSGAYFNYDNVNGIHPTQPGLMVDLLDELAQNAGFSWRRSFAVNPSLPEGSNVSYTDLLLWSVEHFDISTDWWDRSLERMDAGVAFLQPWMDSSLILIDQPEALVVVTDVWNWMKPFTAHVWFMTIFTILLSALAYQSIEFLTNERQGRSMWQWFLDNLYLSSINFSQNFEYAPTSLPGRVFAVSMTLWALLMTATYTANLASLLVEEGKPLPPVESIEDAVLRRKKICTYANSNSDDFLMQEFPQARRYPHATELDTFQSLDRGDCDLVLSYKANWEGFTNMVEYNPECDLEWVGRTVQSLVSGFALKADSGEPLCTSFIRDVLDVHLQEIIESGRLDELWQKHYAITQNQDCTATYPREGFLEDDQVEEDNAENPDLGARRYSRQLLRTNRNVPSTLKQSQYYNHHSQQQRSRRQPQKLHRHRLLKAGGRSASATSESDEVDSQSLTLRQMLGTFVIHYILTGVSVMMAVISKYYELYLKKHDGDWPKQKCHGTDTAQSSDDCVMDHRNTIVDNENNDANDNETTMKDKYRLRRSPSNASQYSHDNNNISVRFRRHGPIIGRPPRLNTIVPRKNLDQLLDVLDFSESNSHYNESDDNAVHPSQQLLEQVLANQSELKLRQQELQKNHAEWQQSQLDTARQMQHMMDTLQKMQAASAMNNGNH